MNPRKPNYPITQLFLERHSARAMSGETLPDETLFALFEAARWAPSSFNNQPWRFILARRQDQDDWNKLFGLLVPFNQGWCKNAAAIFIVVTKTTFDSSGKPYPSPQFEAGMACENLSLEAQARGLVCHFMGGFDHDRAKTELGVPNDHVVLAMGVVGLPGKVEDLPEDLRGGETLTDRRPLSEIMFGGKFGNSMKGL